MAPQYATQCDAALASSPEVMSSIVEIEQNRSPSVAAVIIEKAQEIVRLVNKLLTYISRITMYAVLGLPVVGVMSTAYVLGGVHEHIEDIVWDCCLWAIQHLGPTFVKLAQWASTRPDLYPPALIRRLEALQDDVKVNYSKATIDKTLRGAFGDNWHEFLVLEDKPLGAGCVAQVFKGKLRDAKDPNKITPVAVKLIHPHVEKMIQTDMELLSMFASFLDLFPTLKLLALGDTCREWCNVMNEQLNLEVEANNLISFSQKFAHDSWAAFPMPIEGYVNRHVLVETLMEGTSIMNYMKMKADEVEENMQGAVNDLKLRLSDLGCRAVIKMVFFDNLIHGDMHPGNILVQLDEKTGQPRLVFLDAGIVYKSKDEKAYRNLVDICFAFMKHDGYRAGQLMIDSSRDTDAKNSDAFCAGIQKIIDDTEEVSMFEHLGEYVSMICNLARVHSVRLDPSYFQIAMALKVMEGVALSLNDDLELISKCTPLVVKARALRALGITRFPPPGDDGL